MTDKQWIIFIYKANRYDTSYIIYVHHAEKKFSTNNLMLSLNTKSKSFNIKSDVMAS